MASTQLPPQRVTRAKNNSKLVQYDEYIDTQIRSTRRMVKVVEFSTALVLIATGALAFLLVAAVVEHWLMPGGFSMLERFLLFGVLAGGVGYFSYRRLWPLCVHAINPVYAAQTIEQSSPSLKNSLVNLLLFRQRRADISDAVFETLEEHAAKQLTHVPVDAAVDRTHLIRLGYILVAVAGLAGLYKVFSPKDPLIAAERVLMPWADIVPASRVAITDVTPGAVTIALGEFVDVSAEVRGISESDPVVLRYTTADGQAVNKSISMVPTDGGLRFKCRLPDTISGSTAAGISQNLRYHLEAGDARSHEYAVKVVAAPSILVKRVDYEYPKYTGYENRSIDNLGDLRGIEGTRVTIHAAANGPIEEAYVDFDADGRRDTKMTVDGNDATVSFTLALREDRQTAEHASYVLRFTNQEGRTNRNPVKYPIEVLLDYEPEVRILTPQEKVLDVRLNGTVAIEIEATDPDFALAEVRLHGEVAGRGVLEKQMLAKEHKEKFTGRFAFKPSEHGLKAGDVLQYWATAVDNRTPKAGSTSTERKLIRVGSSDPAQQPPPDRIAQRDQPRQQPGEPQPRDGQRGSEKQQQQDGESEQSGQTNQGGDKQSARDQQTQDDKTQPQPQDQQQQPRDKQNDEASGDKGGQPQEKPQQGDQPGGSQGQQSGDSKPGQQSQDQQNGKPGSANQKNDQGGQGEAGEQKDAGDSNSQKQEPGASQGASRDAKPSDEQGGNQGDARQPSNERGKSGQKSKPGDPKSQSQQENAKEVGSETAEKGAQPDGGQPKGGKSSPPKGSERNAPEPQQAPVSSDGDNDGEAFQRIQQHLERKGEIKKDEQPPAAEGQAQPQGEDSQQNNRNEGEAKNQQQDGKGNNKGDTSAAKEQAGERGRSDGNAPPETGEGKSNPQGDEDRSKSNNKTQDKQKPDQPGMSEKDQGEGPGAETRPGDPQKPVDKQNSDEGNEQSKSPGGQQTTSKGPAGDGQQPGKTEGAPDPGRQAKPREKWEQDKSPDKLKDDKEPAMPSQGKQENSSKGNQGGDETGGGQEGGGQKSPRDGTGSSGQNQSADDGAGESSERGTGNKSADGGQDAPSDHRTGQPGTNQPGEGSSQRNGEGNKPGGASKSNPSDKETGENSQKNNGEQKPGTQEQPSQPSSPSGKNEQPGSKGGREKPDNADAKEQSGTGKQDKGESGSNGTGDPTGGGATGAGAGPPNPVNGETPEGDAANLEYARKQTDLVLEKLSEQLKRKQVDKDLLKELGWTEAEMRTFVARWQKMKQAADAKSPSADTAQRDLDDALRSLGLHRGLLQQAKVKDDNARNMREGYRGAVPPEYQQRLKAYNEGVSRARQDRE